MRDRERMRVGSRRRERGKEERRMKRIEESVGEGREREGEI